MATAALTILKQPSTLEWLGQLLKQELAPYPGRTEVVARVVLAATLIMIVCMTLQVPFAWQAAIYAIFISRETPRATLQSLATIVLVTVIAAAYLLVSINLVISLPSLHFFWIILSFFLGFYAVSTAADYTAAVVWVNMISAEVPLWDNHVPAEVNVEQTIWLCFAVLIAAGITAAVELAFSRAKPREEIVAGLADRLVAVENLLIRYADNLPVDPATQANIARLGMVGSSRLLRLLARSNYSPHYAEQMGAAIALTGRLVDFAANLTVLTFELTQDDRRRVRRLADNIASIRSDLLAGRAPELKQSFGQTNGFRTIPLLPEIERTVALIVEACSGSESLAIFAPQQDRGDPSRTFLVRDAFSNVDHLKFAVKGCLTASLCYIIYNAIDWPGISTAVTTCLLTALSTTGSSRQKQALRFAGATFGGFVLGMGSQVFILPHLDSIAGFTLLFIFVTGLASWFATSSSRLSYFGVQVALAFYLINLQSFAIESSLAIARDRVVGILFGLLMMWLVFDQLWGASAVVEMKMTFISSIRLLAQFAREPVSGDLRTAIERSYSLRDAINKSFNSVRAAADGVLFEFGPSREQNLAWRSAIREWQPQLRTLFLTRIALWKYRAQFPGSELPEAVRARQQEFDDKSAEMLDKIADGLEGRAIQQTGDLEESFERLQVAIQTSCLGQPQKAPQPQMETCLQLASRFERLVTSLTQQIRLPETQSAA
jgi:multidrug resistance protein MdtO